jgi:hypothetical protein
MHPRNLFAVVIAKLEGLMLNTMRAAASLVMASLVVACSGGSPLSSASTPAAAASLAASPSAVPSVAASQLASQAPSVAPSASTSPTPFTSATYKYSLTMPGGWTSIQATAAWDGKGAPFHDVPEADQFVGPAAASAWLVAAPTTKDLAATVKEAISANAAEHGNTCPPVPEMQDPIKIGGDPGTLIAYNCGILINTGITVHKGVAYVFGFRDPAVHAATDPTDRAAFLALLESVRFPN